MSPDADDGRRPDLEPVGTAKKSARFLTSSFSLGIKTMAQCALSSFNGAAAQVLGTAPYYFRDLRASDRRSSKNRLLCRAFGSKLSLQLLPTCVWPPELPFCGSNTSCIAVTGPLGCLSNATEQMYCDSINLHPRGTTLRRYRFMLSLCNVQPALSIDIGCCTGQLPLHLRVDILACVVRPECLLNICFH